MSATAAFRVAPGSPHIPTVIHVDDACIYSDQRRYLNIILAFPSSELTPNGHENKAEALHAPPTLYDQLLKDPGRESPQICPALRVSSLQRRWIQHTTPRPLNFRADPFQMMRKPGETVIGF